MHGNPLLVLVLAAAALLVAGCTQTARCDAREAQIRERIESANYCSADEDCAIADFGCPFGCGSYVNNKSDTAAIHAQISAYNEACGGPCVYRCPALRYKPACVQSKCAPAQCEPGKEYRSQECACPPGTESSSVYNEEQNDWSYVCTAISLS